MYCSALCALQWCCNDLTHAQQINAWLNTSMQILNAGFSTTSCLRHHAAFMLPERSRPYTISM